MTALEIIRSLMANRRDTLWINHERREAAYLAINDSGCRPVAYNDAVIARTDTNLIVAEKCDGELIAAA